MNNTRIPRVRSAVFSALALAALLCPVQAQEAAEIPVLPDNSVYGRVWNGISRFPHRRVGSENLSKAFDVVSNELAKAGLKPQYQTFDSLSQETERLSLTYGGEPVEGVLMIDNGPATFVVPEPIRGPAIFVGNGRIQTFEGKDLTGKIAVLDATLPEADIRDVMTHGARAVILVGDATLANTRMSAVGFTSLTLVPRVYIDRADAERAGLLTADGTREAVLDARSVIRDVPGKNLWVELPSKPGWKGNLDSEEVLILSATLDTYGFTPDYSPELRAAANVALLTQTAVSLARSGRPLNRRVIVVFFGSKYAGLEGARFFYHTIDMSNKNINNLDLAKRGEKYAEDLVSIRELIAFADANNIIDARGPLARNLQNRLKRELVALANGLREPIGDLREERTALQSRLPQFSDEAEKQAATARIAELSGQIDHLQAQREASNLLREQLVKGRYLPDAGLESDPVADVPAMYARMLGNVLERLHTRRGELERMIDNNASWMKLADIFEGRSIVGHFDFDFASAKAPWMFTMINAAGLYRYGDHNTGSYGRHLSAFRNIYYGATGRGGIAAAHMPGPNGEPPAEEPWTALLYEPALNATYKPYSLSYQYQRLVPSVLSAALGLAGFQMTSVGEPLFHDNLPFADFVDLSPLSSQMAEFCGELANSLEISLRNVFSAQRLEPRLTYYENTGVRYLNYAAGSTDSEGVPRRAIVYITSFRRPEPMIGQSAQPRSRILANGRIYMPYIGRSVAYTSWLFTNMAVGYNEDGALDRVTVAADAYGIVATPIHLFYAYGGLSFGDGYKPDPIGGDLYEPKTLVASKDAPHKTASTVVYEFEGYKEFFADRQDPIKIIGGNGDMLLGSVTNAPGMDRLKAAMGVGVKLDTDARLHANNIAQGANDAYLLNEARLAVLRERNIVRDDLEKFHADSKDHIEEAAAAIAEKKWSLAEAHHIFANCIENRIYRPLRGVTEDLVQAVVVLLLLNIPFAFAMERLIFGFPSIYKQLMGFIGFFLATFAILFFTHPAFSLASAPIVIFLAFVIIMLACITSGIMMGKIKQEIRAMQGLASTVHGVVNESSTTLSAILIGIAGMRNRPLKTFLTCITVVLLTFTILVFASFTSQQGVVDSYLGRGTDENRIELHRLSFLHIDSGFIDSLNAIYGDRFDICRRGGLFRIPTRTNDTGDTSINPERVLFLPKSGESIQMSAVMGLDETEIKHSAGFRKVVPELATAATPLPPLFLPPAVTNELTQIAKGDEIRLNGVPFTFAGFFDPFALQQISTIDDLRGVPPDFQATLSNSGSSATGGASIESLEEMPTGTFEWFTPDVVAIARMDDLRRYFGWHNVCNFIAMYPKEGQEDLSLYDIGVELAPAFQGTVHVKTPEGAYSLFFTQAVQGSGFSDVIVPLLLGGLIIFSSLMGSIVAREKEIFTYSALGLAPVDVGALFFAESAVYSVIGGMGGYLVSQLVAKFFKFLGSRGLITPPEMNFSSLTSVCTILIVMAVVMLSTIFPALRASKSANPGVARKWKMPSPKGNKLEFVFPFTVSSVDFAGILSFIREHFNNHADATLGSFAARDVRIFKEPCGNDGKEHIGIEANISLAPFDLGIFQRFRMYSQEFEIKGIDEVVVDLTRIGGTPDSWVRSNRAFAAELREQFLLWRSLPIATVEHYRASTLEDIAGQGAGAAYEAHLRNQQAGGASAQPAAPVAPAPAAEPKAPEAPRPAPNQGGTNPRARRNPKHGKKSR